MPKKPFEERLREAPIEDQLAWTAGVVIASGLLIPAFGIVGVIALAPIWRTTWRSLVALPGELD
jgi:hypothetical protein